MSDADRIQGVKSKKKVLLICFIITQIGLFFTGCAGLFSVNGIYEKKLSYNWVNGTYYHAQVGATASYNLTLISLFGFASIIIATICLIFALIERKKALTESTTDSNTDLSLELQKERKSLFENSIAYYIIGGGLWLVTFVIGLAMNG